MATDILTPVARMVQGSAFEGSTTDAEGNPLVVRNGPNAGQPRVSYYVGVAIPKNDPGYGEIYAKIYEEAKKGFPNLFDANGQCLRGDFAWKIIDGDSTIPNTRNVRPCDQEGFPGNWILKFNSGFKPTVYNTGGTEVLTNPESLKRGYYVRVYGSVEGNASQQRPGVYLNLSMIEFIAYGEEIISGPDGAVVFGGSPAGALPAGASAQPLAPQTQIAQAPAAAAPAPAPAAAAPAPAPAAAAPAPAPAAAAPAPAPAPDFLNGPQVVKYQTSDGGQWTKEQLLAGGWTEVAIEALPKV